MIIRKTIKQIKAELTESDIKNFKKGMRHKPDMADPDALTPTPEMLQSAVRMGRPPKDNPKKSVYIYFDSEVVNHLRATGKGWQTRVSDWVTQGVRRGVL